MERTNKIIMKILLILLALIVCSCVQFQNYLCMNISKAASYSFNFTGPSEANKGDTVTLVITGNGLTGNVKLSSVNASLSNTQIWIEKNSVSITAKITGFPAKITANPIELTDNEYNIVSLSSKTVIINEKKVISQPVQNTTGSGQTTPNPSQTTTSSNPKPSQTTTTTTTGKQSADQSNLPTQTTQNGNIKSSNNYLKSLATNIGTLSPEFYRETFEYTIDNIIENDIQITAEAEDSKSSVNGTGTISLQNGENKINIEVTAENGNVRTYTITVNKLYQIQQSDLRLDSLKIEKINEKGEFKTLDFEFNKEEFDYDLNVEEDIADLNILATVEKEGIIVETLGANNLQEGKNIVTITLINQNDQTMITKYTININKAKKTIVETSTKISKNNKWMVAISILTFLAVVGAIIFVIYYIKNKKN